MKTILIVFAVSLIIYKLHLMRYILRRCQYDGPPVPFNSEIKAERKKAARIYKAATKSNGAPLIINTAPTLAEFERDQAEKQKAREKLEIEAAYIVGQQGHNPATVKYMSDDLLRGLIKDYIKACNE